MRFVIRVYDGKSERKLGKLVESIRRDFPSMLEASEEASRISQERGVNVTVERA